MVIWMAKTAERAVTKWSKKVEGISGDNVTYKNKRYAQHRQSGESQGSETFES